MKINKASYYLDRNVAEVFVTVGGDKTIDDATMLGWL